MGDADAKMGVAIRSGRVGYKEDPRTMAKDVGRVRGAGRGTLTRLICLMTKLFHVEQSTPPYFQEFVTDLFRSFLFRPYLQVGLTQLRQPIDVGCLDIAINGEIMFWPSKLT